MSELEHVQRVGAYGLVQSSTAELLLVRLTDRTPNPGVWTLPGGKVELGEHPEDTVLRELHEETGLTGVVDELLAVGSQVREFYDPGTTGRVYHAVRILYRVSVRVTEPLVVHDVDGSSEAPTWWATSALHELPVTPAVELARPHLRDPAPGE